MERDGINTFGMILVDSDALVAFDVPDADGFVVASGDG